ncbi:MAG: Fe2+-dependent dioxygenase [Vitreimonas sp.]
MILDIKGVLAAPEIERLRAIAKEISFVDGRATNPANETKLNLQADITAPLHSESSKVVHDALGRSREFRDFVMPKRIAPPLLTRYTAGMKYGAHSDSAYMPGSPGFPLRADVSVTVFLNDPSAYEGGELVVRVGSRTTAAKGAAGDVFVYPSTTLHEVTPVRSGERLVSITFVESLVGDEFKRNMLYELSEIGALEGLKMSWDNRVRLETVRNNLLRLWS